MPYTLLFTVILLFKMFSGYYKSHKSGGQLHYISLLEGRPQVLCRTTRIGGLRNGWWRERAGSRHDLCAGTEICQKEKKSVADGPRARTGAVKRK